MTNPKRKRSDDDCEIPKAANDDLISELPDAIIISILSLLPIRDAVKTSILSSRWRHLWPHISHLNFSEESIVGIDSFIQRRFFHELNKESKRLLLRKRASKFMRVVKQILLRHIGTGVESFKVQIFLYKKYAQDLDLAISFAIASGTKELHLKLGRPISTMRYDPYEFPCDFFSGGRGSSVTDMSLQFCVLSPPPHFDGFSSLRTLDLHYVSVTEIGIQNLLSSCLVLERLSITMCGQLLNLKISHTCSHLKHLEVRYCDELRKIEVCASNLVSLVYFGPPTGFAIKNAPRLIRADIYIYRKGWVDLSHFLTGLPVNMPRLNRLSINIGICFQAQILPRSSNKFLYLKHMMLNLTASSEGDLLWVASLLNAAHLLETLELQLYRDLKPDAKPREIRRPSKCPHNHLKSIQIYGLIGEIHQIEVTIYLLNNATTLELMTIYPVNPLVYGDVEMARHKAYEYFLGEVPSTVKLVIL